MSGEAVASGASVTCKVKGCDEADSAEVLLSLRLVRGEVNQWRRQSCSLFLGDYKLAGLALPVEDSDGTVAAWLLHHFAKSGERRWDR